MAMNQLIEGLLGHGHQLKVLAVNSFKYKVNPNEIPASYQKQTGIEFVKLNLRLKPIPAFMNWVLGRSYHVQRFISGSFREKLVEILLNDQFDIVQMETVFMAPYVDLIREHSRAKIVFRAHNIEHLIWQRMHKQEKNMLKKAYLSSLYKSLKKYEIHVLDQFDGIMPISEEDAGFFRQNSAKPVQTIPFGIDIQKTDSFKEVKLERNLFHIGAMNWMPNLEGIKWFLDEVWPRLQRKIPEAKLTLAGREMPDWLLKLKGKNLVVYGEVADAKAFIQSGEISIAPLLSGSGIRIKILESMSMAKPVVSTSVGAEGIEYQQGKNILIADNADEFVNAIQFLYEHPVQAVNIGQNAQQLIAERYNPQVIIRKLTAFYQKIL